MPSMRVVPLRSIEQVDVQAFHRARQRLIEQRNGMTSQIRGLLLDRGVPIAQGLYPLRTAVPMILEDAENVRLARFSNNSELDFQCSGVMFLTFRSEFIGCQIAQ
jgi:hypothetical protein